MTTPKKEGFIPGRGFSGKTYRPLTERRKKIRELQKLLCNLVAKSHNFEVLCACSIIGTVPYISITGKKGGGYFRNIRYSLVRLKRLNSFYQLGLDIVPILEILHELFPAALIYEYSGGYLLGRNSRDANTYSQQVNAQAQRPL